MRRRFVPLVLVLACLVTAGCGLGRDDRDVISGEVQYGDPDSTSTTAAAPADEPGPSGEAAPTTSRRPAAMAPPAPGTAVGAGGRSPGPSSPTSVPDDEEPTTTLIERGDDGSRGPPGAFARTLLRPQPATVLTVERFHHGSAEPEPESVARIGQVLRQVTGGGKDIDVRNSVELDDAGQPWSAEEIRALADKRSRVTQGGRYAVIRVLFLNGRFEGDASVLGVAVRGDTFAVFTDAIESVATPVGGANAIEEAVVVHELGHLLGLVDLARNTGRADPEHPGHSTNERSVMFWAVESSVVAQVLEGPPPRDFDAADLADLQALREGA